MIFGIGTDLVEISRITEKLNKDNGFKNLVFSLDEQEYCNSKTYPPESFAGRFAAKEAFLKALHKGMFATFNLAGIEILNGKYGQPEIFLSEELKELTQNITGKKFSVHVSISHTDTHALATVVIEVS